MPSSFVQTSAPNLALVCLLVPTQLVCRQLIQKGLLTLQLLLASHRTLQLCQLSCMLELRCRLIRVGQTGTGPAGGCTVVPGSRIGRIAGVARLGRRPRRQLRAIVGSVAVSLKTRVSWRGHQRYVGPAGLIGIPSARAFRP